MTRRNRTDALDGFDVFDDLLRIIVVPSSAITLFQILKSKPEMTDGLML